MGRGGRLINQLRLLTPLKAHPWLLVLDFDRTIFDTHRYYQDFHEMLTRQYGAEFAAAMSAAEGASQYFDPFAFLLEHGVSYAAATAAFDAYTAKKYPAGTSYLFADAHRLITALRHHPQIHPAILTTGSRQSQEFKLALCPELAELPQDIIAGNKGQQLQRDIDAHGAVTIGGKPYLRIALVDDRSSVLEHIKPHARHRRLIHILRPGTKYQQTAARTDIVQIANLADVPNFLD
jgi:hypothetical protein